MCTGVSQVLEILVAGKIALHAFRQFGFVQCVFFGDGDVVAHRRICRRRAVYFEERLEHFLFALAVLGGTGAALYHSSLAQGGVYAVRVPLSNFLVSRTGPSDTDERDQESGGDRHGVVQVHFMSG